MYMIYTVYMCNCEYEALGISECPFKDVLIEPTYCRLLRHIHLREAIYVHIGRKQVVIVSVVRRRVVSLRSGFLRLSSLRSGRWDSPTPELFLVC